MYWLLFISVLTSTLTVTKTSTSNETSSPATVTTDSPSQPPRDFFIKKLIEKYGSDGTITIQQLDGLLKQILTTPGTSDGGHAHPAEGTTQAPLERLAKGECSNSANSSACYETECLSAEEIFSFHGIPSNETADSAKLEELSPTVLYQAQNSACRTEAPPEKPKTKPTPTEVWGYGFLSVTAINLCAVLGIVFLPLMKKKFYQIMLMFMVALAVGTLAGSALLVLIPEALGLQHVGGEVGETYMYKATVVFGGIYLFFLTERLLQIFTELRQSKRSEKFKHEHTKDETEGLSVVQGSIRTETRARHDSFNMSFKVPEQGTNNHTGENGHVGENGYVIKPDDQKGGIKPVAWMVIFGDGLHNFIDGLSIGAAFAENILAGISLSLAVICEELPHELGDFAILLNAGMSMKRALLFNFLSACMCYLGLVCGILIGENTSGSYWIFAVAGGMFLYISLVDMLPEVNHAAEMQGKKSTCQKLKMFVLQSIGLIAGFGIIFVLSMFAGDIDLTRS